jgi:hypothetical protein
MNIWEFLYKMVEEHPVMLIILTVLLACMLTDVYKLIVDLAKSQ